ncbi:MAG: RND transporter, partial [Cyclobacteriaceae bacterium]|nr:RND transporter [Cyclobacteriaceae bacterium]
MNKNIFIIAGVVVAVGLVYMFFGGSSEEEVEEIFVEVKKGDFQIDVTTTGELEAKSSVDILGPDGLRRAEIYQLKIEHIVDEGTVVNKGDYIALMDRSELINKVGKANNDLQQNMSEYIQVKMDTALELRKARDEIVNLEFDVEEKKII